MSDEEEFDLDEDIFGFEVLQQELEPIAEGEEPLESIFATFQSSEDTSEVEAQSSPEEEDDDLAFATSDDDLPDLAFSEESPSAAPVAAAAPAAAGSPAALAPVAAPAVKQGMTIGTFSKSALLILISVTLLNGMVGFVILRQSSTIMENVSHTGTSLLQTARDIKRDAVDKERMRRREGVPLPVWDVENHPTFELAAQDIEDGNFREARKKLRTFLALIDGIDPTVRSDMEARAKLLIASSITQEAITRALEDDQ